MSFWEFVKNYLSPVMLFMRLCWLGIGAFIGLLAYSGQVQLPALVMWAVAALFVWIALRPWGTTSVKKMGDKLDDLNRKYR